MLKAEDQKQDFFPTYFLINCGLKYIRTKKNIALYAWSLESQPRKHFEKGGRKKSASDPTVGACIFLRSFVRVEDRGGREGGGG